jgi:2-C-methyl-D-erythritol 2,4-cyclodiphosphate synthase
MRIGIGHDTHRLSNGGPLRLGGLTIAHDRHLVGHSDADVLLHAITDALLGALALGDIGELFPDTDSEHRGADSKEFLLEALRRVHEAGYRVAQLDTIVFAQRPHLSQYKEPMRRQIADWLQTDLTAVSVKAKTGEEVGPIGRQEAIAAEAVVLLLPRSSP